MGVIDLASGNSSTAPPAAVVVDDCRLNRECLVSKFAQHDITVGTAWDLPSLFDQLDHEPMTAVLLNFDTRDSATLLQVSLDLSPRVKVIVYNLPDDDESQIIACAESGVAGLHLRSESFDELLTLVRTVSGGQSHCSALVSAILLKRVYSAAAQAGPVPKTSLLTSREMEILELLGQGLTNQQIASRLCLTLHTVKNHVHSLLTKLGVTSRSQAALVYRASKCGERAGQRDGQRIAH